MRTVVSAGGFRVTQETGSALVASKDETSFYIWTTENADDVLAEPAVWKRLDTIAGTPVYGEGRLRRFWSVHGFVFWIQAGPLAAAVAPRPIDLEPLITASQEIHPPPP